MTKKSNKCHRIIFTRNTYTEEQKELEQSLNITEYYKGNVVFLKVSVQVVMINILNSRDKNLMARFQATT